MNSRASHPALASLHDRGVRTAVIACVALAAFAAGAPVAMADSDLSPSPATVAFSDQGLHGGFHQSTPVSFTNGGGSDVTVSSLSLGGDDPSQFDITGANCVGATIADGDACQAIVEFDPTSRGAKNATLTLVDDTGTVDVPLTGTAITGTLTANPNPLTFNPQPWFYGGQQQGINLDVSSDAGVQVTSAVITGPDAARFSIVYGHNCVSRPTTRGRAAAWASALPPGAGHLPSPARGDQRQRVQSAPGAARRHGADRPARGHLTRSGGFRKVGIGQERTMAVVVTNDGDAPMQVQQLLFITGRPDVFFVAGDTCSGGVVDPGDTCQAVVHFKPTAVGEKEASLFFITGNAAQPVISVGVNGEGVGRALQARAGRRPCGVVRLPAASWPAPPPAFRTTPRSAFAGFATAARWPAPPATPSPWATATSAGASRARCRPRMPRAAVP